MCDCTVSCQNDVDLSQGVADTHAESTHSWFPTNALVFGKDTSNCRKDTWINHLKLTSEHVRLILNIFSHCCIVHCRDCLHTSQFHVSIVDVSAPTQSLEHFCCLNLSWRHIQHCEKCELMYCIVGVRDRHETELLQYRLQATQIGIVIHSLQLCVRDIYVVAPQQLRIRHQSHQSTVPSRTKKT